MTQQTKAPFGARIKAAVQMVFGTAGGSYSSRYGRAWDNYPGSYYPGSIVDYSQVVGSPWHNSAVSICLGWIADNLPQARIRVTRDPGKGEPQEVKPHLLTDLLRRPNHAYSGRHLLAATAVSRCVSGDAYWMKARSSFGFGKPVELWHVPFWMITPQWDQDGSDFITSYLYRPGGSREIPLKLSDVVHFRAGLDPENNRLGWSPLKAILREIATDNEIASYTRALLTNLGVPGAVMSPRDPAQVIPDDARKEIEDTYAAKFTKDNRGRAMVVSRAMNVEKPAFSPEEMALDRIAKRPEARICAALKLPAMVVGLNVADETRTFCLPASARVWTLAGAKRIADVRAGEIVWSLVDGCLQPRRVLRQWKTGRKRVYELRTKNRRLRATGNHPILARSPGRLGGGNNNARRVGCGWVPLGELKVGDWITQPTCLPDQEGTLLPDGREATPDMLQFLGALVGDGTVLLGRCPRVDIAMPLTDRAGTFYRAAAERLFTKRKGTAAVVVAERPRSFGFCSADDTRMLAEWGFGGRAKTKRIPGWVFGLARHLRLAFLAGLVDSDGHIDKRGCLSFTFCNQALTEDVRDLLISCGIQCCNIAHGTYPADVLPQPGRLLFYEHWCFTASSAVQIAAIPFSDAMYRARVEANGERTKREGFDAYKTELGAELGFYGILSIVPQGVEDVYDLEVEGGHSFVADGVIVHNSNWGEARSSAWEECIIPMLGDICETLDADLLPDLGNSDVEDVAPDYSKVRALQEDQDAVSARATKEYQGGGLMLNEYRQKIGQPEVDGGKVFFIPKGGELVKEEELSTHAEATTAPKPPPAPFLPESGGDQGVLGNGGQPALAANGNGRAAVE
jgi:HK97 family phage portal protein